MSLRPPVSIKDHVQGNMQASVELLEYGDYQCPYCGQAYPIIKAIQRKFGKDLKFVFRNFPLAESHPQARIAAIAAEAADRQGKFWEMHDTLYENQRDLHAPALMGYAKLLGLDIEHFQSDIGNNEVIQRVEDDFESGVRSGVNGTPGFFINGEKYNYDWGEESLALFIKNKLKQHVH